MTAPAILFGSLLAAAYAAAYHFIRPAKARKLLLYVLFSELGFWAGHLLGASLEWEFAKIGPLNTAPATLGAIFCLVAGGWLSQVEITRK